MAYVSDNNLNSEEAPVKRKGAKRCPYCKRGGHSPALCRENPKNKEMP